MNQLNLHSPVTPFKINQGFGDNEACIRNRDNVVITWDGRICPTGYRSLYGNMDGHNGLDLMAKQGQQVYASHDGIVCEIVNEKERGLGIGIVTNEKFFCIETNKEEFFKTRYWHNSENKVKLGDKVKVGDLIALAGSSGYASGPHLHLEVKPVVIVKINHDIPVVENCLQENGYFGAVNPIPYLGGSPYLFHKDMELSQKYDREVEEFQKFLTSEGLMDTPPPDGLGIYGPKTRVAIFNFQQKYVGLSLYEKYYLKGSKVGPKTRSVANTIITRKFYNK